MAQTFTITVSDTFAAKVQQIAQARGVTVRDLIVTYIRGLAMQDEMTAAQTQWAADDAATQQARFAAKVAELQTKYQ